MKVAQQQLTLVKHPRDDDVAALVETECDQVSRVSNGDGRAGPPAEIQVVDEVAGPDVID